jgi:hypothetical protein
MLYVLPMPSWKYLLSAGLALMPASAMAHVWEVGPSRALTLPSQAAAKARDGDTIRIDAGAYDDCATWTANNLIIEGEGEVVLGPQICQDKAIFVIAGARVTVQGLTFRNAHATAWNGAGIRAEGADLTVLNSNFQDNEDGILAGGNPDSHIVIRNSVFTGNGSCQAACAHGIYVGEIASLDVSGSTFFEQHAGHHIKSRAHVTQIVGNSIRDGERGTASFAVDIPDGGSLILKANIIEKGPNAGNHLAAVSIGAESLRNPTGELTIADNQFTDHDPNPGAFVLNHTATAAALSGNRIEGAAPLNGPGSVTP